MSLSLLFFILTFVFVWTLLKTLFNKRMAIAGRAHMIQTDMTSGNIALREDEILEGSLRKRLFGPVWKQFQAKLESWSPDGWKAEEQKRLSRSGMSSKFTVQEWLGWRVVSIALCLLLFGFLALSQSGVTKLLLISIGLGMGWYYPTLVLKQKATQRQKEITRSLPDVLDLLTVSVEAGLGFDAAISKVVEKTDGALSDEFARMLQEIRMGKGRRDALRDLGKRTGNPDLLGFVSAIVQADQLGVSIGNVLRIQSDDLRNKRKARAEEQAMKAPIKILFPLILFIFPAIFIIILGPAIINIKNTFIK